MRLIIPTGLTALLANLDRVLRCCDLTEMTERLSASFRQKLEPTYRDLREQSTRYAAQKWAWDLALARRREGLDLLSRLTRDAWLMLRRRDQRERHQGLLISLYNLPRLSPQHASAALWLEHGRNLVLGEERARAAGHAPMAFPSAAELAAALAEAQLAEADYQLRTLELKQVEQDLRQRQRQAAHLLRGLAARLRESQFDRPAVETRNLLRSFGFRFKSTPSDDEAARAEQALADAHPPLVATGPANGQGMAEVPAARCLPQERQTLPVAGTLNAPAPAPDRAPAGIGQSLRHWARKLGRGPDPTRQSA